MGEPWRHRHWFRVRYGDTDQLRTVYSARVLDWFEVGRTELLRDAGLPYAEMEEAGACLPVIEAHVNYRGRTKYDDRLEMRSSASMVGKARVRFEHEIVRADGGVVADGWTTHAVTDPSGKAIRPPKTLVDVIGKQREPSE